MAQCEIKDAQSAGTLPGILSDFKWEIINSDEI